MLAGRFYCFQGWCRKGSSAVSPLSFNHELAPKNKWLPTAAATSSDVPEGWSDHWYEDLHEPNKTVFWNQYWLVVSTHLKNISQNGNLPKIGVKIKNIWNHHLAVSVGALLEENGQCSYFAVSVSEHMQHMFMAAYSSRRNQNWFDSHPAK